MTLITVEISDPIHQWLNAQAGLRGLPLDQFVTSFLAEHHRKSRPSANEASVLSILQNLSQKSGWVVPAKSLWGVWKIRGTATELETALHGLTSKGFVEESQNIVGYVLTSHGFSFQPKTEFA